MFDLLQVNVPKQIKPNWLVGIQPQERNLIHVTASIIPTYYNENAN